MQTSRLILTSAAFAAACAVLAAQAANGPFLEKPYLQLGNAPKLENAESLVLMWHTPDQSTDWGVEVETSKHHHKWRAAPTPQWQTVNAPEIAPHRVYTARI